MTEAEQMYYGDHGGCSCHLCAPCSFCMAMDDDEATAHWNGGRVSLQKLWAERGKEVPEELPESQWVTIYSYE